MKRLTLAVALVVALMGCQQPGSDLAKLDVADPTLPAGWQQIRDEPGGFSLQAPQGWLVSSAAMAATKAERESEFGGSICLMDGKAALGDEVTFTFLRTRNSDAMDMRANTLYDAADAALEEAKKRSPDAKSERIQLPIGPAQHVTFFYSGTFSTGTRRMKRNNVVFVTALRFYLVYYSYPLDKEAQYGPTCEAMLRSIRLFLPKKDGKKTLPPETAGQVGTPYTWSSPGQGTMPPRPSELMQQPSNQPLQPQAPPQPQGQQPPPNPASEAPVGNGQPPLPDPNAPPSGGPDTGPSQVPPPATGP